ncbi:MAG: hypothetical protein KJ579_01930 [Verrucomicrobia bacterium]|nr:hypothetical protein [Verrucomicrobiota bacterium]
MSRFVRTAVAAIWRAALHRGRCPAFGPTFVLLFAAAAHAADPSPREAMKEGRRQLQAGDLPAAAAAFDRAAQAAPDAKLDPARARYNQGLALQQQDGKDAEAEAALDQALRTTDVRLQSRVLYNRGHLLGGRARALQQTQKLPEAQTAAGQALSAFADSLLLAPSDNDARVNYEMTQRFVEELRQQVEQQKQQQPDSQPKQDPQKQQDPQKSDPQPKQDPQQQSPPQPQDQPQDGRKQEPQKSEPAGMNEDPQPAGGTGEEKPEDMSKEEAMMLLDAMKAEEAAMREKLRLRLGRPVPVDKDW